MSKLKANATLMRDLLKQLNGTKSDAELLSLAGEVLPVYLQLVGREEYLGHPDQLWGPISYAQRGEDLLLLSIFESIGLQCKSYLDIGAHHPTIISNTKLLYDRGATGVNVEANPALIQAFKDQRPRDTTLCYGVVGHAYRDPEGFPMTRPFYMFGSTSGRNTFSKDEVASLDGVLKVRDVIDLPVVDIKFILDEYFGGYWPDLLNIDAEGMDIEILEAADFSKTSPVVVCVESRSINQKDMISLMHRKTFEPYCKVGDNLIFLHEQYMARLGLDWRYR